MRLSLRAMMILIVIVGVFLGWQVNRARATRRAIRGVEAAGGVVTFNDSDPARPGTRRFAWIPSWIVDRLGAEYFYNVIEVSAIGDRWNDHESRNLLAFPRLEIFSLARRRYQEPETTDATLKVISSLPRLRKLELTSFRITDKGLRHLKACHQLESLSIDGNRISGIGLRDLASLPKLRELRLNSCPVDDDGINALAKLTDLEILQFGHHPRDCWFGCDFMWSWPHLRDLDIKWAEMTHFDWESLTWSSDLESLRLAGTNVTDQNLVAFRALLKLRNLDLTSTSVSPEAVAELKRHRPAVAIVAPIVAPSVGSSYPDGTDEPSPIEFDEGAEPNR